MQREGKFEIAIWLTKLHRPIRTYCDAISASPRLRFVMRSSWRRSVKRACTILLMLLPAVANAAACDIPTQLRQAALSATATYQSAGLAGLVAESQDCYETRKIDFYCINYDVAAGYLDRRFASAMGINRFEYFDAPQFLERARPIVARARWSMETSNKYLQFADGAVQSVIDEVLGRE